jgi:hypothetical protein
LLIGALASPAFAQDPPAASPAAAAAHPPVRAVRTDRPINVDGLLNEDIWRNEHAITSFTQRDPDQGQPPRQRTEARVVYDDDAVYIGARMYDTAPDSVVARLVRRDDDGGADAFSVMLDPYRDKRTGYFFQVSAAGVLADGVLMNDGWDDWSWDGVWMGRAQRDAQGWTCEMRIPFSQMRFTASNQMVWGINLQRSVSRTSELDALTYTPRGQSGYVSRFAELHGLDGLKPARNIEVTPYATNKTENLRFDGGSLSQYSADDPFHGDWKLSPAVGGDLRMSVGSRLTLNATVNPDFGQVEIDPAVVNLSDVESFFEEKRPFFTEGVSVFRCGNNGANDYWGFNWPEPIFFYSRRIGRAPQGGTPDDADFIDRPVGTHILGAAKLTGQAAPGWNIGTVQALTNREEATLHTLGNESRFGVEPMSYYGVYRFMHERNERRQGIGLMTMTTARFFDGGSDPLRDQVNDRSVVAAMDGWTFLDTKRTWVVSGYATASQIHGTSQRIENVQTGFPHYYQRPDRPDLGVDPSATSLTGWGSRWWLNKQQGRLLFNAALGALSQGYNNNDLGFQFGGDIINNHVGVGWQWEEPKSWRQYANVLAALANTWDFGGNSTLKGLYVGGRIEGRNRWSYEANTFQFAPAFSARKTRGGPLMATKTGANYHLYFDTNGRNPWFWWASYNPSFNQDGTATQQVSQGITWRPVPNLGISGGPEYLRSHIDAQFIRNTSPTLGMTGSQFSQLEQTQLSMSLRADYSVTPNLSFQVYVQPLLSTLRFHDLKELARSRTYDLVAVSDPLVGSGVPLTRAISGTFGSLRGNAVVRWEYLPGSTAYFVWTQERAAEDGENLFDFDHSYRVMSKAPANNVFLVKVAHHFDL